MKALSLFTGAGGADLGITEAGIEVVRGVEWEAPAVATCHAAGLDYVRHGDVRDLELYEGLPPIDLLFGGPPCQAFSSAGNRQGQDDLDRNGWPWTLDVIDHVEPRWALLENVPGLLHHSKDCADPCPGCYWTGELLPAFRARFPWVEHRVLNASSYGVPQHRRRVFLVCGPGPIRWPDATHGDPSTFGQADLFSRSLRPWATVRDALGLELIAYARGRVDGAVDEVHTGSEPSCALRGSPGGSTQPFAVYSAGTTGEGRPTAPTATVSGKGTMYLQRPSPSVTAQEVKGTLASAASGFTFNGGPDRASDAVFMATGRRRLSVAECAILQDFPPGHPFQGTKTAQYRQVGNAWPRAFGRVLGCAILEADRAREVA